MNMRELELQNIIKALQSKVHALKREIATNKSQEQTRIEEATIKQKEVIEEKEKTVIFLKEEINKIRKQTEKEIKLATAHYEEEERKSTTNLIKYKNQCEMLEAEFASKSEIYENRLKEKQTEISKLLNRCQTLQRERKMLAEQRQQFNKFYLSSMHKLPEREETLLWVDKLIEFMSKTQNILSNQSNEKELAVNQVIKSVKEELGQINNVFIKNDAAIYTEKLKFIDQLHALINQAQEDYDEAVKSNQEFWEGFSKFRSREEGEMISRLESQLANFNENHKKEIETLQQGLKTSEKQKKSLMLSFQEMKNLYELKDKGCRQEIEILKQSISELLEGQQIREKEFQTEIQRLGEKIEQITTKFYEKLSLPIQQVSQKIKLEIENFKSQFQGFYGDSLLQGQLETFENHIVQYLISLNNSKEERNYLKQVGQSSLKLIEILKSTQTEGKIETISTQKPKLTYSTVSYESNNRETSDKENKLNYELATVKRQLEKLKEHCKLLEGKSKIKDQFNSASRTIELAAQNELLKERLQTYERNSGEVVYSESRLLQRKLARVNSALLQKLLSNSEFIIKFAESENIFIDSMSKCISSLNTFFINPLQMFERLINQIDTIKVNPERTLPIVKEVIVQSNLQAKKEAFSSILNKKAELNAQMQKTSNELTKALRELLAKCISTKNSKSNQQEKLQVQKPKQQQSRHMIQKRIKEVQTQRVKNRQEMISKLKILDERFKVVQQKNLKKQNFSFNKIEDSIIRKIQELINAFNSKEKLKDIKKVTESAFNDLQSKLKECLIENKGLLKENQMLRNTKF